jgi:hypothetical protein
MTNPITTSDSQIDLSTLGLQLTSGSQRVQQQIIPQLATLGNPGLDVLIEFLLERRSESPSWIDGKAYQILHAANYPPAQEFLQTYFPTGLVSLQSECGIDYSPLQQLLIAGDFQAADRMTLQKMCELAGAAAVQRKWLYFTEIENFTISDLQTINTLWLVYSEGKFGFSVQREIWLSLGKNWEKFWAKIGWKNGNTWTRYPDGFTWNLTAPVGHLPLSNQLRGNRVIAALFSHPAWLKEVRG